MNERTASSPFASKYGPWAVVAGASEGLGAAFAAALAARGLNVLLLARRAEHLEAVAERLRATTKVEVRTEVFDMARPDLPNALAALTSDLDIGLAVYNAAYAPVGDLVSRSVDDLLRVVDVNVRGPLVFARTLAPKMVARGRGGIVLMSSLAGYQGAPRIATYAASKAFNIVLGESLWRELRPHGVDVVVCSAGAIRTPGYAMSAQPRMRRERSTRTWWRTRRSMRWAAGPSSCPAPSTGSRVSCSAAFSRAAPRSIFSPARRRSSRDPRRFLRARSACTRW